MEERIRDRHKGRGGETEGGGRWGGGERWGGGGERGGGEQRQTQEEAYIERRTDRNSARAVVLCNILFHFYLLHIRHQHAVVRASCVSRLAPISNGCL